MRATAPTFDGPQPVAVAGAVWGVPRGTLVAHAEGTRGIVYVLLPGDKGDLRCLTHEGEVPVPPPVRWRLLERHFPDVSAASSTRVGAEAR